MTAAAGTRARLERLVQQAGRGLVLRNRRDLRRRELLRIDLRRPGQHIRAGVGHVHRRRRQRRERHVRARLRRDPAAAAQAELQARQARRRPQVGGVRRHAARAGDADAGKGAKSVEVVYAGKAKTFPDKGLQVGKRYRYTVSAFNAAGNQAGRTINVTATGALLAPAPGERVTARPRLTWTPTRGASYYNVQLVRGGTILSVWPRTTSLTLPRSWVFHGHRYRLHRGVYHWYVWPGFGRSRPPATAASSAAARSSSRARAVEAAPRRSATRGRAPPAPRAGTRSR